MTISELRYVPKEQMIADCLPKTGKLGEDLLKVVRTGSYNIPGGVDIRESIKQVKHQDLAAMDASRKRCLKRMLSGSEDDVIGSISLYIATAMISEENIQFCIFTNLYFSE